MIRDRLRFITYSCLAMLVLVAPAACERTPLDQTKADEVARAYVLLLQQDARQEAYGLLADSERAQVTVEEYDLLLKEEDAVRGDIVQCTITPTGDSRVLAEFQMRQVGDAAAPVHAAKLDLVRRSDGTWQVSHGDYLLSRALRARSEPVSKALAAYGEQWAKKDYASMASASTADYLRSRFADPPYDAKLQSACAEWESNYGPLDFISCTYQYVRFVDSSTATIPAKLCYHDATTKAARFAPYVATLRLDPVAKQWKIADLVRTATYQRPVEVDTAVPAKRRANEDAAIGGK